MSRLLVGMMAMTCRASWRRARLRQQPAPVSGLPPGEQSKQEANDRQRRLHGKAADVGRLPFGEQRAVVEHESRRLLGDVDVDRGTGEDGGDDQGELSGEHGIPALAKPTPNQQRFMTL